VRIASRGEGYLVGLQRRCGRGCRNAGW